MSDATVSSDESQAKRREPTASEVFMTTFASVGSLALLDIAKAEAATTDAKAPLAPEDARDPLRASGAPNAATALGPPAGTDAAFQAGAAALRSPFEAPLDTLADSLGAENEMGVANWHDVSALLGDNAGATFANGADLSSSRSALDPTLSDAVASPASGTPRLP